MIAIVRRVSPTCAAVLVLAVLGVLGCSARSGAPDERIAEESQSVTGASLAVNVLANSCGSTQAQYFFQVVNSGTVPVKLSDIAIKFWLDDTTGAKIAPAVDTGGCVTNVSGNPSCAHPVSGVTASADGFSPACGPDPTHQANWEITLSDTDKTTLPPGAVWDDLQSAIHLATFANFSPGEADWYGSCVPNGAYAANPRFVVTLQGVVVAGSGGEPPACRRSQGTQQLHGYVPPAVATAPFVGPMSQAAQVKLAIGLPARESDQLQAQLAELYDPLSTQYRMFLTPSQFAAAYGPTPADYQTLIAFATSHGLTVTQTYGSRQLIDVSGTVANVESAFFVFLNVYRRPDGTEFYAPDGDPSLNLALPILRIDGLDDFARPQRAAGTGPSSTSFGDNSYMGSDFRNAYFPGLALTGTGQTVALVAFDGFDPDDIAAYKQLANLPDVPVTAKPLGGFSGFPSDQDTQEEVSLDIEMAISMAPGLSGVSVYEEAFPGDLGAAYDMAAADLLTNIAEADPLPRQISASFLLWGGSNAAAVLTRFMAQGQSFFIGSGDDGAYGVASSVETLPEPLSESEASSMTVVGGTQLVTGTGAAYQSETTWNDVFNMRAAVGHRGTSGGGVVPGVPIPDYQSPVAASISAAGGNATLRNIPDVSLVASDILVISSGAMNAVSGTSASGPLWAGIAALANEEASMNGFGALGFANPSLYAAARTHYADDFNDINDDSTNSETGVPPFSAVAGYDLATGWGTPRTSLLDELSLVSACATLGTPQETSSVPIGVDTGLPPSTIGNTYGGPGCPNHYLAEFDLTSSAFAGHDFFAIGGWSVVEPVTPCDYQSAMVVYVFDGSNWTIWDQVHYAGDLETEGSLSVCHANPVSHSNAGSSGLGGTSLPAGSGFTKVRVSVQANEAGTLLPVSLDVQAL